MVTGYLGGDSVGRASSGAAEDWELRKDLRYESKSFDLWLDEGKLRC